MANFVVQPVIIVFVLSALYVVFVFWLNRSEARASESSYLKKLKSSLIPTRVLRVRENVRRRFSAGYYIQLEKTELHRKSGIRKMESRMTDMEYQLHIRKKYGNGMWADRLINELTARRELVSMSFIRPLKYLGTASLVSPKGVSAQNWETLARWEGEGGATDKSIYLSGKVR